MLFSFDCDTLPIITSFYSVTRNTRWQLTEKNHILLYISSGSCLITLDGGTYLLNEGDVCYIPEGHPYTRESVNNTFCTMTYIHFISPSRVVEETTCDLAKKLAQQKRQLEIRLLEGEQNPEAPLKVYLQPATRSERYGEEIASLFSKILHASSNRHLMHNMTLSVNLCSILLLLSRETVNQLLSNDSIHDLEPVPQNLKRVIEYIVANYTKPITLEELASQCHVSKQQVIRYFKAALNTTPIQYINSYRLAQAKELLFRQPQLTIKEIAAEVGFDSPHYFTRLFTTMHRETPSQYRERAMNHVEVECPKS